MAFGHQRSESLRLLLREIAQSGPIPRIDLSERTGISRATVTTITADLLRGGLIEEITPPKDIDARRGRPKVNLKISGGARLVAGIKVSDSSLSFVLMDFEGADLVALDCPLKPGRHKPEDLAEAIAEGLQSLALVANIETKDISGVGVALAGLIRADTGLVYWSPSLTQRNVNFVDVLTTRLNCPVFVDNDANLVAMAEAEFGHGRKHSDFIVVTIESGVGMGIVIGGQLYRGARGSGGEFGHTKVQLEGALCRCGQRGCLEAYVADYALQREAASVGLVASDLITQDAVTKVLTAAKNNDALAKSVVDRAGRMFALGLANLVNIFDPELIILAGEQMQFDHLYAETVIEQMRKSIVDIDKPPPEVVVHKWGNAMWARGAAAFALDYIRDLAVDDLEDA
ncbi:MAG: ROK family transcriptional regulator [Paracoccaceae bacterium]